MDEPQFQRTFFNNSEMRVKSLVDVSNLKFLSLILNLTQVAHPPPPPQHTHTHPPSRLCSVRTKLIWEWEAKGSGNGKEGKGAAMPPYSAYSISAERGAEFARKFGPLIYYTAAYCGCTCVCVCMCMCMRLSTYGQLRTRST